MFLVDQVSLQLGGSDGPRLLDDVSVSYPRGHFGAIIGPSGCGKTTLLKLIAGIAPGEETGDLYWEGRNLDEQDFDPSEIAYVPQFSIAHDELTVRESVRCALALRVRGSACPDPDQRVDGLLREVGISEIAGQRVKTLSGGQLRRLSLAMELTSRPDILLCDEVTSGLDPQSEHEIVGLLQQQAREAGRMVISVTHSLQHLTDYDSVLVLIRGRVAYHGPPGLLTHYFGVENAELLYARLAEENPSNWGDLWREHGEEYSGRAGVSVVANRNPEPEETDEQGETKRRRRIVPNPVEQFRILLVRRNLIFLRSVSQILLQLGLILGFPLIVAIFAWNGLPAVRTLSVGLGQDIREEFSELIEYLDHSSEVGSVVSGIVMFQVILLTLMGANNSGREIAAERAIFEKEKLSGLSPIAYLMSKTVFLSGFVLAQSLWMGLFVHYVCEFPGDLLPQLGFLLLVNLAITSICLGISSLMHSAEQASLVSIYLVGFQLPLSGAVLALPDMLGTAIRPFISAYWSWSGILQSLKDQHYYDIVKTVAQSPMAAMPVCVWVLGIHIVIGLVIAWIGCERRRIT